MFDSDVCKINMIRLYHISFPGRFKGLARELMYSNALKKTKILFNSLTGGV